MYRSTPVIHATQFDIGQLRLAHRIFALVIALGCLSVLVVATMLPPNAEGVGTHTQLGFSRCQFLYHTHLPCPSCGITTSFAWCVRGNMLASLWVQPFGTVLAVLTAAGFWIGLYMAASGNSVLRLVTVVPAGYYVIPLMFLAIAAWGWKIVIHVNGIDGWR